MIAKKVLMPWQLAQIIIYICIYEVNIFFDSCLTMENGKMCIVL